MWNSTPVIGQPDATHEAALAALTVPQQGRALRTVLRELDALVWPHQAHTGHPRFFGFVPGPVSPLAQLGDRLTARHNPHAAYARHHAGAAWIEHHLINWLSAQLGMPAGAGGLFLSGGSLATLTAVVAARERFLPARDRAQGMVYCTDQAHSSVFRALRIAGFLPHQIRCVATDSALRMDPTALARTLTRDRAAGRRSFLVVASAGTTATGAVDPLRAIRALCPLGRMWLHVDGALGASAALVPAARSILEGIDAADSVTWDAHKWLFQTWGSAVLLAREPQWLRHAFTTHSPYLHEARSAPESVPADRSALGPELTRPARAVSLWLTLQVMGASGMAQAIAHGMASAQTAQTLLQAMPGWEVVTTAQLGILTFRHRPEAMPSGRVLDRHQELVARQLRDTGLAAVFTTRLRGQSVLRLCTIHPQTTHHDLSAMLNALDSIARRASARADRAA